VRFADYTGAWGSESAFGIIPNAMPRNCLLERMIKSLHLGSCARVKVVPEIPYKSMI
jgi:hypothetical protein